MSMRMALAASLVAIISIASPVMGATAFRQPQLVSPGMVEASLVVIGGQPHIAAVGEHGIWYFTRENGVWAGQRLTYFPGDRNSPTHGEPAIAADPVDGSLTIVFERRQARTFAGGCGILGLRSLTNRSGNWSAQSDYVGDQEAPSVCMTDPSLVVLDGHIYVASAVRGPVVPNPPQRVRYLTNVTGDWTSEEMRGGQAASLALDSHGNPQIASQRYFRVNEDEVTWTVWRARGTTPTGGFVKDKVADVTDLASPASLALSSSDKPRVAWSEPDGVHYAVKTSSGWDEALIVPGLVVTDLVIDSFGMAHMSASGGGHLWYLTGPQNGGAGDFDAVDVTAGTPSAIDVGPSGVIHIPFQRGGDLWWVRSSP
jgi:hypothetical protein